MTIACARGFTDTVKELIQAGANVNPNIDDVYGFVYLLNACGFRMPLIAACKNDNLWAVRLLLKAGASLNLKADKKTPIQIAYEKNNFKIADELIKVGAIANSENTIQSSTTAPSYGKSVYVEKRNSAELYVNPNQKIAPLIIACRKRNVRTVKLLIKAGADIDKGSGRETPLDVACQNKDWEIIKMLLKAGANVNSKFWLPVMTMI